MPHSSSECGGRRSWARFDAGPSRPAIAIISYGAPRSGECQDTKLAPASNVTFKESPVKTYRIFISHSWAYKEQYKSLIRMLTNADRFSFVDYSVPPDDPIHDADDDEMLRREIRNQMSPCHVILILAGVYATYSRWINEEIDLAESGFSGRKAIVAIEPWGAQRTSARVKNAADRIVRWNTQSIVRAIREVG